MSFELEGFEPEKEIYSKNWEKVSYGTARLRVPDGWLFSMAENGICFVPDKDKIWVISET